eukprot:TRINITY_DN5992_c0_g1_i3.p1 TRINITY_DN5992_c0_g1~~TRINITY_DN5992_c0_g1_i3.p1  ORF type:complete len:178 (+),score=26.21 TRINITY_DN5992_c0_g1_i3:3-536(+)
MVWFGFLCFFFFFQAEDGIRDFCLSRGLGDVYKRQVHGFAAPWLCNLKTTYLVLVGWNIEIILTFLLLGLFATKILPKNKELKIFGINNRHFCAIILSIIAVSVELILNHYGALVWEFKFWNAQCPYLIFLIGYLPFFEICYYIHDLPTFKNQLSFILSFTGIAVSMLFGSIFQGLI